MNGSRQAVHRKAPDRRPTADGRKTSRVGLASFAVGSAVAVAVAVAVPGVAFAASPRPLPASAEAMDVKFQPAMDYDSDGCYPASAVGPDGTVNGGLKPTGSLSGGCHDRSDLDTANMYSRSKCNHGWCAIAYALYFEKDQAVNNVQSGHRHDWEHTVVWVQDDQVRFVSASRHGGFSTRPANQVLFDRGSHAKIVYHKDGISTHAFRFAGTTDDPPENAYGRWHYPALVGWNGFPAGVRDELTGAHFGSAVFSLRDDRFTGFLAEAKPAGIAFDPYA